MDTDYQKAYKELLLENASLKEEINRLKLLLNTPEHIEKESCVPYAPHAPYVFGEQNIFAEQKSDISDLSKSTEIKHGLRNGINNNSGSADKINLFMSLFKGRNDLYAKRWYSTKTGKSGYSPVCKNEWKRQVCNKPKIKCNVCTNRQLAELNEKVIEEHLRGNNQNCRDVIGVYPMNADECCYFLAIDFDGVDNTDWQKDVSTFRETSGKNGFEICVERSRSGHGAHIWFFFNGEIPAALARKFGTLLLTLAMDNNHEIKFSSYDRLFPNQDTLPSGGFGNLIALPLQGQARKQNNSVFVDENFIPYKDQWEYLSRVKLLDKKEIESFLSKFTGFDELGVLSKDNQDGEKSMPLTIHNKITALEPRDFTKHVVITHSNMLHIGKAGSSQKAMNMIRRLAAFKNPEFYKAQAMRLPVYDKPRIINTSEENEYYISLPRGLEPELTELLKQNTVEYIIEDKTNHGTPIEVKFRGVLRDDQQKAAEAILVTDNAVLQAATGFGKTVIAAKIIAERKVNALILVHTTALLKQWAAVLRQFLEFPDESTKSTAAVSNTKTKAKTKSIIGQIGGGKSTANSIIDVAIMQSLIRDGEVNELVTNYGMVIVDECHHVSAFTFEKILKTTTARYVYGLSATPVRQDGHHPIIFMQCGKIAFNPNTLKTQEQSFLKFLCPRFTQFDILLSGAKKEMNITKIYTALSENVLRNNLIISDITDAVKKGRTPLVLTQRKNHAAALAEDLTQKLENVILLTGSMAPKEKREALERIKNFKENERFVIVATGKFIGEGFDEPRLDALFLASPVSWRGTLQQYTGRLHRATETKNDVIVYDYVDMNIRMLEGMYHKRLSAYKNMNYKLINFGAPFTKGSLFDTKHCGAIYDAANYHDIFESDLENARREIVISAPYIQKSWCIQLLNIFCKNIFNGIRVICITKHDIDNTNNKALLGVHSTHQLLQNAGVNIILKDSLHQNFAVIDQTKIWYGGINFLSAKNNDASSMRFENAEIAGELLRHAAGN